MWCCLHEFPLLYFTTCFYYLPLPADLLVYVQCPYWPVVDKFLLDSQNVRVKGSIGELHLLVCPYFSRSVSLSCSSYLDGFRDWRLVAVQLLFCRMLLLGFVEFLCNSHLDFFLYTFLGSLWCLHIVVLTRPLLRRNCALFYRISQISIWSITYW